MTQKTLLGILGLVVLLIIAMALMSIRNNSTDGTATTTPDGATTTGSIPADLPDGTYQVNGNESLITWTGSKPRVLGYQDTGTVAVTGGTVTIASGAIVSGDFSIDMSTISGISTSNTRMGVDRLVEHLKSDDFFAVATYPTSRFVVTNVENGIVTGDLTVKATTAELSFPATVRAEGENRLVAEADITIDRTQWDIRYGSGRFFQDLGDNLIADEVELVLNIVATKQ